MSRTGVDVREEGADLEVRAPIEEVPPGLVGEVADLASSTGEDRRCSGVPRPLSPPAVSALWVPPMLGMGRREGYPSVSQ